MNINNLSNLLTSDKTPIVLLFIEKPTSNTNRGVAFIIKQKGKTCFIATNRHHFVSSGVPPKDFTYVRSCAGLGILKFRKIHYPESETEDFCIIELKAKKMFKIKNIPLEACDERKLEKITRIVTMRNSIGEFGCVIELFNTTKEVSYLKMKKTLVYRKDYASYLYDLTTPEDNAKYVDFLKQGIDYSELVTFVGKSVPGVLGSPVIAQTDSHYYAIIGINQGGVKGQDIMFFVPLFKVIKLLNRLNL